MKNEHSFLQLGMQNQHMCTRVKGQYQTVYHTVQQRTIIYNTSNTKGRYDQLHIDLLYYLFTLTPSTDHHLHCVRSAVHQQDALRGTRFASRAREARQRQADRLCRSPCSDL